MAPDFMIYGANGFVGEVAARQAVQAGLRPILAGRNAARLNPLAAELGAECRIFDLRDPQLVERSLQGVAVVLHCAGPFIHTYRPLVEACLRTGTHYLDLTGEIPVYAAIAGMDAQAKQRGVMLLPGVGFDVVPTDCLALHLKQRLPSAARLTLAFCTEGPAGFSPGTQRTIIEHASYGIHVRRDGRLEIPEEQVKTRMFDFGSGPVRAFRATWGDIFTAYYSTGIPNIEDYIVPTEGFRPGPTAEQRSHTSVHVWGEVEDDQGRKAAARLHGPEAGVDFTVEAALAVVRKVLSGSAPSGYQTPATAYGPDFVLECPGVTREGLD